MLCYIFESVAVVACVTNDVRLLAYQLPAAAQSCHSAYILESLTDGSFGQAESLALELINGCQYGVGVVLLTQSGQSALQCG